MIFGEIFSKIMGQVNILNTKLRAIFTNQHHAYTSLNAALDVWPLLCFNTKINAPMCKLTSNSEWLSSWEAFVICLMVYLLRWANRAYDSNCIRPSLQPHVSSTYYGRRISSSCSGLLALHRLSWVRIYVVFTGICYGLCNYRDQGTRDLRSCDPEG